MHADNNHRYVFCAEPLCRPVCNQSPSCALPSPSCSLPSPSCSHLGSTTLLYIAAPINIFDIELYDTGVHGVTIKRGKSQNREADGVFWVDPHHHVLMSPRISLDSLLGISQEWPVLGDSWRSPHSLFHRSSQGLLWGSNFQESSRRALLLCRWTRGSGRSGGEGTWQHVSRA